MDRGLRRDRRPDGRGLTRAVAAGAALAAFGAVAVVAGLPALFPALGPSLYLLATRPDAPACDPRRVVVAHLVGLAAGAAARAALGPAGAASLSALAWGDVAAAVAALIAVTAALPRLDADHPPAAATTLIAALGAFGRAPWAAAVAVAVLGAVAAGVRRSP